MPHQLTGSRIRDRRMSQGIRQRALAQTVGISPSYLNLIEHNRRRIGGRILHDIARALDLDPAALSEGAPEDLVAELEQARAGLAPGDPGDVSAGEFAQRYPGWARLLAQQSQRIEVLSGQVAALTDRIANDPELQTAVHEVLSVVTSIRSSASILVSSETLDRDWEERFYTNIFNDSRRLAESSQALVHYLETPKGDGPALAHPWEQLNAWLDARGHHVAELEVAADPLPITGFTDGPGSPVAALGRSFAARYHADAKALPVDEMVDHIKSVGLDPGALSQRTNRPLVQVMRRLASLPQNAMEGLPPIGLAIIDGAGNMNQLKTFSGFGLPPNGPRCPLWPLFGALAQPTRPIRATVALPGPESPRLTAYAIAEPERPDLFDGPPLYISTMIVIADARARRRGPSAGPAAPAHGPAAMPVVSPPLASRLLTARRKPTIVSIGGAPGRAQSRGA